MRCYEARPDPRAPLGLGPEVWRMPTKAHGLRNLAEYEGHVDMEARRLLNAVAACDVVSRTLGQKWGRGQCRSKAPPRSVHTWWHLPRFPDQARVRRPDRHCPRQSDRCGFSPGQDRSATMRHAGKPQGRRKLSPDWPFICRSGLKPERGALLPARNVLRRHVDLQACRSSKP
ncbi:MAG: hypothetical protein EPN49_04735 [Rhodanobacter sp.]|nr:MAG: hypothetical protein EPN49_04735 [Rhodanobacter sp.]